MSSFNASKKAPTWSAPALLVALLLAFATCFGAPRAAAQLDGVIEGNIMDVAGKPWAELGVQIVSETGQKADTKTDAKGHFTFRNLRSGTYDIFIQLPAPNQPYQARTRVLTGTPSPSVDLNFKDIVSKQGAEYQEKVKKAEEEKQKFTGMKQHFEAGVALLDQVKAVKADLLKVPADQRDALKSQIADLSGKAVTELESSQKAAPEKDSNLPLVWARLADAYDAAGRMDDAINAYKQAIQLKPVAGYYNNLGGLLGRSGKIEEATAAYTRSAELDPPGAAQAWRNFGITMYNAGKYQEGIEPLKKATELDPKNAQSWYLLASCLVADPSIYKTVGAKIEVTPKPGTVEAYQKAIELEPNGPWGVQAKQGLDQLNQMTGGIETKVGGKKKK